MSNFKFFIETIIKDWKIATSYRVQFFLSFFSVFFTFLFLILFSSLVDNGQNTIIQSYKISYFQFLFFGIIIAELTNTLLNSMPLTIRNFQQTGIFEEIILSGRSEMAIIISSLLYPLIRLKLRILLYVLIYFFYENNLISFGAQTLISLILFVICLIGISFIGCAVTIVLKGSAIVPQFYLLSSSILSGVAFPVEMLPNILILFSDLLPTTHFLAILRADMIQTELLHTKSLVILAFESVLLIYIGIKMLKFAISNSKKHGNLLHH